MLLGIHAKLKNGKMLKFRQETGFNQRMAAAFCCTSTQSWWALENLRFDRHGLKNAAQRISVAIGCDASDIYPEAFKGCTLGVTRISYKEVDERHLISATRTKELPSFVDDVDRRDAIDEALKHLTQRQRQIIELRFGLNGKPMTLDEVGEVCHIGRERVRQIEATAIRRLQHPFIAKHLEPVI